MQLIFNKSTSYLCKLDRSVYLIEGQNAVNYLQGLTTNDLGLLNRQQGIPNLMLNSQGRIIADFMLTKCPGFDIQNNQRMYLDVNKEAAQEVFSTIKKDKIKEKIDITDLTKAMDVYQQFSFDDNLTERGLQIKIQRENQESNLSHLNAVTAYSDPRLPNLGVRVIAPINSIEVDDSDEKTQIVPQKIYHFMRMFYGIAEYPETKGRNPLSFNLHKSAHISLNKGLYVGQEVTNRSYYLGNIKRTVLPFMINPPNNILDKFLKMDIKGLLNEAILLNEQYKLNLVGKQILKDKIKIGQIVANVHNLGLAYMDPTYVINKDNTSKLVNCYVQGNSIFFWSPNWLNYNLEQSNKV